MSFEFIKLPKNPFMLQVYSIIKSKYPQCIIEHIIQQVTKFLTDFITPYTLKFKIHIDSRIQKIYNKQETYCLHIMCSKSKYKKVIEYLSKINKIDNISITNIYVIQGKGDLIKSLNKDVKQPSIKIHNDLSVEPNYIEVAQIICKDDWQVVGALRQIKYLQQCHGLEYDICIEGKTIKILCNQKIKIKMPTQADINRFEIKHKPSIVTKDLFKILALSEGYQI